MLSASHTLMPWSACHCAKPAQQLHAGCRQRSLRGCSVVAAANNIQVLVAAKCHWPGAASIYTGPARQWRLQPVGSNPNKTTLLCGVFQALNGANATGLAPPVFHGNWRQAAAARMRWFALDGSPRSDRPEPGW